MLFQVPSISRSAISYVQTEKNDNHVRLRSRARKYREQIFFPNLEHKFRSPVRTYLSSISNNRPYCSPIPRRTFSFLRFVSLPFTRCLCPLPISTMAVDLDFISPRLTIKISKLSQRCRQEGRKTLSDWNTAAAQLLDARITDVQTIMFVAKKLKCKVQGNVNYLP